MKMSFGERLIALLKEEGVSALYSQGDLSMKDIQKHAEIQGFKIVGPRHEASGVFMAMGHYVLTGKPQVALGAIGPGQANLLPAAVTAAQEHIPVILMGARRHGRVDRSIRRGRWLYAPLMPMFDAVCKFTAKVDSLDVLDEVVREAFRQALSGTPGPVYIEYDYKLNEEAADFPTLVPPARYRALPQPASQPSISQAVGLLRAAKSIVLLGGERVHHSRAHGAFAQLARLLKCPVLTTYGGTGAVPETDEQWLMYMSQAGQQALADADVLLAVGTCFPELANYGRLRHFSANDKHRQVIVIEPDAAAVGVNRPVDIALVGAVDLVLAQLIAALASGPAFVPHPRLPAWRQEYLQERQALLDGLPRTNRIYPGRLMAEARKAVPEDAIIVVDGGLTMLYQHSCFQKTSPDFLYTANFSHLGTGLGLAIGAGIATQGRRPICLLSGDGALGFHIMDFETAVRHQLPLVVVLNDDQALGAEMAQHMEHIGHQIEVAFGPVRYSDIAVAMGGFGVYVDKLEDIVPAVRQAFASGRPAIVHVATDQDASYAYMPPYIEELVSWLEADPTRDGA